MQYKRILALAGAVLLGVSAFAQNDKLNPGSVASPSTLPDTIPYTLREGLILVPAVVGKGSTREAVLATGLPLSIVSKELADQLAIIGTGVRDVPTLAGKAAVQNAQPQAVTIGGVPINAVPMGIFDLYSHLSTRQSAIPPAVWLGWTALGTLSFTIDPERRVVILQPTGEPISRNAFVVPITVEDGRIYLQAKLNGHRPVRMLVDTASVGTLIPADAARALALTEHATVPFKSPAGKESRVTLVSLNELTVSPDIRMKDIRAIYVSIGDEPDLGVDTGVLGTDALLKYKVTINYGRSIMAFEKIEPKKDVVKSEPIETQKPQESPAKDPPAADP